MIKGFAYLNVDKSMMKDGINKKKETGNKEIKYV